MYIIEEGRYGGVPRPEARLTDRFDHGLGVRHILAYDGEQPVAAIRVNLETGHGLPPETHFDFRSTLAELHRPGPANRYRAASGSMLVIRGQWRRRYNILRALYRAATHCFQHWGATHVLLNSTPKLAPLYRRIGFIQIHDPVWISEIGDHVVPMVGRVEDCRRHAFGLAHFVPHLGQCSPSTWNSKGF
ncbi:GNAT family N-acetyltransferase [Marichromatium bheemlicum]|uniref:GNAT family N-acetyltransferase n=1 Tax=Marichromatium bheemlicum TaxID=365339 RepID=A0ABX1I792_9GAMM|nr:GNAT family N-acetyltransferase [Marichromatium bheemlicum]NKN33362.1 GNAT family N-acetyltransferase [Marichromatium bheemlicum]